MAQPTCTHLCLDFTWAGAVRGYAPMHPARTRGQSDPDPEFMRPVQFNYMVAHFPSRCCGDNRTALGLSLHPCAEKCTGTSVTFSACMHIRNRRLAIGLMRMPRARLTIGVVLCAALGRRRLLPVHGARGHPPPPLTQPAGRDVGAPIRVAVPHAGAVRTTTKLASCVAFTVY